MEFYIGILNEIRRLKLVWFILQICSKTLISLESKIMFMLSQFRCKFRFRPHRELLDTVEIRYDGLGYIAYDRL